MSPITRAIWIQVVLAARETHRTTDCRSAALESGHIRPLASAAKVARQRIEVPGQVLNPIGQRLVRVHGLSEWVVDRHEPFVRVYVRPLGSWVAQVVVHEGEPGRADAMPAAEDRDQHLLVVSAAHRLRLHGVAVARRIWQSGVSALRVELGHQVGNVGGARPGWSASRAIRKRRRTRHCSWRSPPRPTPSSPTAPVSARSPNDD